MTSDGGALLLRETDGRLKPERLVLDLDGTDLPLHGHQDAKPRASFTSSSIVVGERVFPYSRSLH